MKPNWAENNTKYQRALSKANNKNDESEVKTIYISFGGKVNEVEEEVIKKDIIEENKPKKGRKPKNA